MNQAAVLGTGRPYGHPPGLVLGHCECDLEAERPALPDVRLDGGDLVTMAWPFSPETFAIRCCSKVGSASPVILTSETMLEFNPGEVIRIASGT